MIQGVEYWTELSDYDLETAEAMLLTKRYLYVGFMCHQSIEKILKAIYTKFNNDIPPYTHNLIHLCEIIKDKIHIPDEILEFMTILMPLNIESRYLSYKEMINNYLTDEVSKDFLIKTKSIQKWIKEKL